MKDLFKLQSEGVNSTSKIMVLDLGSTGVEKDDVFLLGYASCIVNTKLPKHEALKFTPFTKEEDLEAFSKDGDGSIRERQITPLEEQFDSAGNYIGAAYPKGWSGGMLQAMIKNLNDHPEELTEIKEFIKSKNKLSQASEEVEVLRDGLRDRYKKERFNTPIEKVEHMQDLYVRWLEDQLIIKQ